MLDPILITLIAICALSLFIVFIIDSWHAKEYAERRASYEEHIKEFERRNE